MFKRFSGDMGPAGAHAFVRFNNAVGLTSKATDWLPEVGVVFSLGR